MSTNCTTAWYDGYATLLSTYVHLYVCLYMDFVPVRTLVFSASPVLQVGPVVWGAGGPGRPAEAAGVMRSEVSAAMA